MKKTFFPILIFFLFAANQLVAQEILATVRVITPQIQQTDRKVFDQLEVAVKDFLNNRKWTSDQFEPYERIKVNLAITIDEELGPNTFKSQMQIQATRPVFGSAYESPLLTHLDKDFSFSYEPGQPLDFNIDLITDNLSAMLAYYANLVIGLDYDTFSPFGGESYYQTMNTLVTNIPQGIASASAGWRANDGGKNRNRFWLAENYVSPRLKPFRGALYTFHRNGLDQMSEDTEKGKIFILQALEDVDKANTAYFNSMAIQMFGNAKRDEIIEMFKVSTQQQKSRVYQIMSKVDPSNAQRYHEMGI